MPRGSNWRVAEHNSSHFLWLTSCHPKTDWILEHLVCTDLFSWMKSCWSFDLPDLQLQCHPAFLPWPRILWTSHPLPPGVPSAPRNVVSVVNQTSVALDWHSPRDIGHREDLSYNVICRRCHSSERRACQPCDDGVLYIPGRRGLKETRVDISKLRAHTSYTFEIQVGPPSGNITECFQGKVCPFTAGSLLETLWWRLWWHLPVTTQPRLHSWDSWRESAWLDGSLCSPRDVIQMSRRCGSLNWQKPWSQQPHSCGSCVDSKFICKCVLIARSTYMQLLARKQQWNFFGQKSGVWHCFDYFHFYLETLRTPSSSGHFILDFTSKTRPSMSLFASPF